MQLLAVLIVPDMPEEKHRYSTSMPLCSAFSKALVYTYGLICDVLANLPSRCMA